MKKAVLIIFYLFCLCIGGCNGITNETVVISKINGVVFDGPGNPPITNDMISNIETSNANWVAVIPEAITYTDSFKVKSFFNKGQWYGESIEGALQTIKYAKENDLNVMLKPHIQLSYNLAGWKQPEDLDLSTPEGYKKYNQSLSNYIRSLEKKHTGNGRAFEPINQSDWEAWEKGYEAFILELAKIADSTQVALFCIGTELSKSAVKRPEFWRSLVKKVKKVYSGPLTYGANWDNYKNITFWDQLDYIGISAYFPVTNVKKPSVETIVEGWKPYYKEINEISKKFDKKIVFTEYGYRSVSTAGIIPWIDGKKSDVADETTQANLYSGLYKTFWNEPWFQGGFIWKWYYRGNGGGASYSPYQKEAMDIVKNQYSKK